MNSSLLSGQAAIPLIKGIYCLLSAERAWELTALLAKGACHQEGEISPLAVVPPPCGRDGSDSLVVRDGP